ncbi:MAG: hypothetical protein LBV67_10860 [Streptococcaceae bacterium]|jgi:DNA-binding transcriptional regulator YhcF (GntR family)|nr:hypothetical protein [Streptococcaceae bacterium]
MKILPPALDFLKYHLPIYQKYNVPIGVARELLALIVSHCSAPCFTKKAPDEVYFGWSNEEVAKALGTSVKTIERAFKDLEICGAIIRKTKKTSYKDANKKQRIKSERQVFVVWSIFDREEPQSEIEILKAKLAEAQKIIQELDKEIANRAIERREYGYSDLSRIGIKVIKAGLITEDKYYAECIYMNALLDGFLTQTDMNWFERWIKYTKSALAEREESGQNKIDPIRNQVDYLEKCVNDSVAKYKLLNNLK